MTLRLVVAVALMLLASVPAPARALPGCDGGGCSVVMTASRSPALDTVEVEIVAVGLMECAWQGTSVSILGGSVTRRSLPAGEVEVGVDCVPLGSVPYCSQVHVVTVIVGSGSGTGTVKCDWLTATCTAGVVIGAEVCPNMNTGAARHPYSCTLQSTPGWYGGTHSVQCAWA